MRHKNISPADATDRHRNHAGCLSTTQIAPPVRRIGTDISQAERDVENVECGMWNVECGMLDVKCGMLSVECGHAPREYFSHRCHRSTQKPCGVLLSKNTDITDAHGWVFSRIVYSCSAAYCLGFDAPPAQRIATDFSHAENLSMRARFSGHALLYSN